MQNTEKPVTGLEVVGEKTPSDLRIEQIAEIKHITKPDSAKASAEKNR
ncbi:hypothetical protein [Methanosarcina barkeri]|nr:hypothetical protein [Methanosarcina barkeri]